MPARIPERKRAAGDEPAAGQTARRARRSLGYDPQESPDAGVEPRPRVVAVEIVAGDPELAAGAVGDEAVEMVGGADAAAGAEPLGGGVDADLRRIRAGDVRPLQPGVAVGLEDVRLGVAGGMDDAEAEVLAGPGPEDRRLGITA